MKLETVRISLTPFTHEDNSELIELAGNWEVVKMTSSIPFPYKNHHASDWIDRQKILLPQCKEIALAIRTDTLVGCVSLFDIDDGCAEIGYWVGEPYWGSGYASEATEQMIKFAFDVLRLTKVEGWCLKDNPASSKVMEKNGFTFQGEHKNQVTGRLAGKTLLKYEIANSAL